MGPGSSQALTEIEVDANPPSASHRADAVGAGRLRIATALAALLVVIGHFRPWEGSLVEEWGMVLAWQVNGFGAYTDATSLGATLARPLLLLPHYLGLEISRGSVVGLYVIAALAALAQMTLAVWASGRLGAPPAVRIALGLAVSTHPWWLAGYTLRYLSAQVAVAFCLLWFAAVVRFVTGGRRRWLVVSSGALIVGLLTYPGPALAVLFGMVAVLVGARLSRQQALAASAATIAVVGAYAGWALLVAPQLASTYEAQLMAGATGTPRAAAAAVVRTIGLGSPALVVVLVVTALVVISLGFVGALTPGRSWLALLLACSTVGASLIFYPSMFHLQSAEHVPFAVGLAAWFVLCGLSGAFGSSRGTAAAFVGVTLAAALAASAAAHIVWGEYGAAQRSIRRGGRRGAPVQLAQRGVDGCAEAGRRHVPGLRPVCGRRG